LSSHFDLDLRDFYKTYTLKDCVKNIGESWNEVGMSCLNKAWKLIYPQAIHAAANEPVVDNQELVDLGTLISGEEICAEDVEELLKDNIEEMMPTDDDYLDMFEQSENETDDVAEHQPKVLSTDAIRHTIHLLEDAICLMQANDEDALRVESFEQGIKTALRPYRALLSTRMTFQPKITDCLNRSKYVQYST